MGNKYMKLLLIEDDVSECNIYKKIADKRTDIEFVAITDSDIEGIKYVKQYQPDGIILDLELNKGNGSGTGFDFIEALNKLNLKDRPKIVVTTNICSDTVYDFLHQNKVEFIFYNQQNNYSQENVINTLLLLNGYKSNTTANVIAKDDKEKDIIADKINHELDLIGIATYLQGRKYLFDSIYYIIENGNDDSRITTIQYLVKKYKKSNSTISRAMQNAILHAWRVSPLEDLSTYYTARINYETGIPTPTEFIYYYADKIKKQIQSFKLIKCKKML